MQEVSHAMSLKQETSPPLACHPAQQDWEERNGLVIFLYISIFIEEASLKSLLVQGT